MSNEITKTSEPQNEITEIEALPAPNDNRLPVIFNDPMKIAEIMATGRCTIPKHLQGSVGDCFAIAIQAKQWGNMNPFSVAQKTHLVNGTLGYEAQLVNSVVSASGAICGRFHYEYIGDWEEYRKSGFSKTKEIGCGVNVGAVIRGETELTWLPMPLFMENVKTRNSPNWATNPAQQIGYLAVKNWARLYTPGAILGIYSDDELASEREPVNITPPAEMPKQKTTKTATLKEKLNVQQVIDASEVKSETKQLTVTEKISSAIEKSGAPVTMGDVIDYLRHAGALGEFDVDEIAKYPGNWQRALAASDYKHLIDQVAEWSLSK